MSEHGLTATNITNSSADLSWTVVGNENAWNLEYGPAGFSFGSGILLNLNTNNPYTLSGLNAATAYDIFTGQLWSRRF